MPLKNFTKNLHVRKLHYVIKSTFANTATAAPEGSGDATGRDEYDDDALDSTKVLEQNNSLQQTINLLKEKVAVLFDQLTRVAQLGNGNEGETDKKRK